MPPNNRCARAHPIITCITPTPSLASTHHTTHQPHALPPPMPVSWPNQCDALTYCTSSIICSSPPTSSPTSPRQWIQFTVAAPSHTHQPTNRPMPIQVSTEAHHTRPFPAHANPQMYMQCTQAPPSPPTRAHRSSQRHTHTCTHTNAHTHTHTRAHSDTHTAIRTQTHTATQCVQAFGVSLLFIHIAMRLMCVATQCMIHHICHTPTP